jgi:hypothetical protein
VEDRDPDSRSSPEAEAAKVSEVRRSAEIGAASRTLATSLDLIVTAAALSAIYRKVPQGVARWYTFKPTIQIWVNFWRA